MSSPQDLEAIQDLEADPITQLWLDHFPLADPPESTRPMFKTVLSKVGAMAVAMAHFVYGLKPAVSSISGYLNAGELLKVVIPAVLHGGGTYAILVAVVGSASTIFAAPYVSIAVAVLTAVVQVMRLLGMGPTVAALAAMKRPPR